MGGAIPGSSAGGEQPKFTVFSGHHSSHVIVKFSPKGDNDVAIRWRDILITEYHAAEAVRSQNFFAAENRLLEMDSRLFLESVRFDRSGEYGRLSMVSLQSIDAEFTGIGSNWPQVMDALLKKKLVRRQHVLDVEALWCFGRLINNTDMHLGNLSLAIEENVFRPLPLYDMGSMGFAPRGGGEVPPYNFVPSELKRLNLTEAGNDAMKMTAHDFWERVANDERISDAFKSFLSRGNPVNLM
jgi:serine/threonine protein kinase HipA of HipAB toxin-antitoxin module